MINTLQENLNAQRAIALLTIKLTARNDIILDSFHSGQDIGIDFIATVEKNGRQTARMFGIELKSTQSSGNGKPGVTLPANRLFVYRDIAFPLCLITFVMNNDKGYFKWLVEPAYSLSGQPILSLAYKQSIEDGTKNIQIRPGDFTELTDENLGELIMSINQWYDAREQFSHEVDAQVA